MKTSLRTRYNNDARFRALCDGLADAIGHKDITRDDVFDAIQIADYLLYERESMGVIEAMRQEAQ